MEQLPEVLYYINLYGNINALLNFIIILGFMGFFFIIIMPAIYERNPEGKQKAIRILKKFYIIVGIAFFVAMITPTNRTFEVMMLQNFYGKDYPKMLKYLPDFKECK